VSPSEDQPWRPTKEQIADAEGATVPDVVRSGLDVLFVGINPGLYSGAVGHHFARPGNRFWKTLHGAGFTKRVLSPFEERELLNLGIGITNIVERATATADKLSPDELRSGATTLEEKVRRLRPRVVAFLGMSAYRTAFDRRGAGVGLQDESLAGVDVWVLPNPSGLNAKYQLPALIEHFGALREMVRTRREAAPSSTSEIR
jgi:TDG/mug DNA glycosylase family protein